MSTPPGQYSLSNLKPIQQQAIALLLEGLSQSAVARRLKVDRVTVARWVADERFKKVLQEQLAAVQEAVNSEIRDAQLRAVDTIASFLGNSEVHDRTRLEAAKYLLERGRKLPEPPPVRGIPAREVEEFCAAQVDALDRCAAHASELLGLPGEYRALSPFERAALGIAADAVATYLEVGHPWQPTPGDALLTELITVAREPESRDAVGQVRVQ